MSSNAELQGRIQRLEIEKQRLNMTLQGHATQCGLPYHAPDWRQCQEQTQATILPNHRHSPVIRFLKEIIRVLRKRLTFTLTLHCEDANIWFSEHCVLNPGIITCGGVWGAMDRATDLSARVELNTCTYTASVTAGLYSLPYAILVMLIFMKWTFAGISVAKPFKLYLSKRTNC